MKAGIVKAADADATTLKNRSGIKNKSMHAAKSPDVRADAAGVVTDVMKTADATTMTTNITMRMATTMVNATTITRND